MQFISLPSKLERHKRFGSVPSVVGKKPTIKEEMVDLQNKPQDYLFAINSVGICNVKHPIIIQSTISPNVQTTIAQMTFTTSLTQQQKGINMSRITEQLEAYSKDSGWRVDMASLGIFAQELMHRMDQDKAEVELCFPWFFERRAPSTGLAGLMHADLRMKVSFSAASGFQHHAGITIAITTLCPCSKEISEYSAHNQRGYVSLACEMDIQHLDALDWKVQLLEAVESNASAALHPVLKRPDEKAVTEKAYENPRFVEDMVRLIAADLYEMNFVKAFTVDCRNEESIHQHDAVASITYFK